MSVKLLQEVINNNDAVFGYFNRTLTLLKYNLGVLHLRLKFMCYHADNRARMRQ
jgi:hypothetical protein